MSYLSRPIAAIIQSYISRQACSLDPTLVLRSLSWDLAEAKGKFWTLDPEASDHYVYVYTDPRKPGRYSYRTPSGKRIVFDHRPFYVGKGKHKRASDHLRAQSMKTRNLKNNTLKAVIKAGFDPSDYVITTLTTNTDSMAQALEIDVIAGIGRCDTKQGPLANRTSGGDGAAGVKQSKDTRLRRSISVQAGWDLTPDAKRKERGSKVSSTKARWSEVKRAEISRNMSEAQKKIVTPERRALLSRKTKLHFESLDLVGRKAHSLACQKAQQLRRRPGQQIKLESACTELNLVSLDPYVDGRTKLRHQCNACSYIWSRLPTYTINGKNGCPRCNSNGRH